MGGHHRWMPRLDDMGGSHELTTWVDATGGCHGWTLKVDATSGCHGEMPRVIFMARLKDLIYILGAKLIYKN